MQARAIFQAACELRKIGENPYPEVMIPLVGGQQELRAQKEIVERVAQATMKSYGVKVRYMIGTMIELPRACLVADQIAREAEFFSFGTNDLTQTCLGLPGTMPGNFFGSNPLGAPCGPAKGRASAGITILSWTVARRALPGSLISSIKSSR